MLSVEQILASVTTPDAARRALTLLAGSEILTDDLCARLVAQADGLTTLVDAPTPPGRRRRP